MAEKKVMVAQRAGLRDAARALAALRRGRWRRPRQANQSRQIQALWALGEN